MTDNLFFNRDISWLYFNERVLQEAAKNTVPLMERIRFLSIYSSNLDEFYRVRMPLVALQNNRDNNPEEQSVYNQATAMVNQQLQTFGQVLISDILPGLQKLGYHFLYHEPIPEKLSATIQQYFFTQVAGLIQLVSLNNETVFFPENNQLYMAVQLEEKEDREKMVLLNIPCNVLPRFYKTEAAEGQYIIFLEDIIRANLRHLFPGMEIKGAYNIKITRDAELNLVDEYGDDQAEKIEGQLAERDLGFASRLLYEPGIPLRLLYGVISIFNLQKASVVQGGKHHNLKDLASLPINGSTISYPPWPALQNMKMPGTLFDHITATDAVVHTPYQSYDTILRFFNEASIDPAVQEVYTTLYRVASDSRIVQALISAAKNGKKVMVLVELKARFDEANNINWAKRMKANGVKIVYTDNAIKVHAKIALVKRKHRTHPYLGLLATGNLNESTARFYTDHILLTSHTAMLTEMEQLFGFLAKKRKPQAEDQLIFKHLLVAQFNLHSRFMELIDREIENAKSGLPASIIIKMNNLEEETLIRKLYEASNAGVHMQLIVRGICRLVPGVMAQSENISVRRIVDRYLEHGRVFIFSNNGDEEIYLGSADWMNRNIYRRIEVCFPVYDAAVREELKQIISLQIRDNTQSVWIEATMKNKPVQDDREPVRSQQAIYQYLQNKQ
ncbi:MAG: polyphosphate kinase 1 [Bacteroidota bacterium]